MDMEDITTADTMVDPADITAAPDLAEAIITDPLWAVECTIIILWAAVCGTVPLAGVVAAVAYSL